MAKEVSKKKEKKKKKGKKSEEGSEDEDDSDLSGEEVRSFSCSEMWVACHKNMGPCQSFVFFKPKKIKQNIVSVIPKEGLARARLPVLLLVPQ